MYRNTKNIADSVHQRLLNKAREAGRPFNELLQYFAIERFIYRLSMSPYAGKFIIKGALMFNVWIGLLSRPTKDIDLLGKMNNSIEVMTTVMKDVSEQKVEPDGLSFDADTMIIMRITEGADYEGLRVRIQGNLGQSRISLQIDIGFGDVIFPKELKITYPAILEFPSPRLKGYSMESTIAEKFHTMVNLGVLNSRMKDFFDIWFLSRHFDFKGKILSTAIQKTFKNRETDILDEPEVFRDSFATEKRKETQWAAFVRKTRLQNDTPKFHDVISDIKEFLHPIVHALARKRSFQNTWIVPGPWK